MNGAYWYLDVLLSVTAIVLIYSVLQIQGMWITYVFWLLVELLNDKFTPFADMYILGGHL